MAEATVTRAPNSRVFEPDALNAARAAAAAAGVSLEQWLTRTIMTTASRVNAAPHGHYPPQHDAPAMTDNMARHLQLAQDAAQTAGVSVTDWLNQAILESVQRERARPAVRSPVDAPPPQAEYVDARQQPPARQMPSPQPAPPPDSPTAMHRQTPLPSALTGTASQPVWRAEPRRPAPGQPPMQAQPQYHDASLEHDAAVQDELDARLARIITATRAEMAREDVDENDRTISVPEAQIATDAPPRRRGSVWLTAAMIVLLIGAAGAIWLIPNMERLGWMQKLTDLVQPTTTAQPRSDVPSPKVTDVTPPKPRTDDLKLTDAKPTDPKPGDTRPADPRPADPRASDPRSSDPKATDAKPGDPATTDPKIADPKPGDTKSKPDAAANRTDSDELPRPVQQYVDWYQRAATDGNVRAQIVLAHMYLRGEGVAKDQKTAAEWFRRAATDGNNAEAQYSLGVLYERGVGVEKDRLEALLWYERAARQNHVGALYNVGVAYAEGVFDRGVRKDKDYARAREYFLRAAELGDAESQYNLGVIFQEGLGTEKDPVEALKWFSIATARNYKRAGDAAQKLIPTMTQEQRDRASELVLEYNQRQKR